MFIPFLFASRYLYTHKKKTLTSFIALTALISITFATTALLCALAVFSGLENLTHKLFQSLDPPLKVQLKQGKNFFLRDIPQQKIQQIKGIINIVPVLEKPVMLQYKGVQAFAILKGVDDNFLIHNNLSPFIVQGKMQLKDEKNNPCAILGHCLQKQLGIPLNESFSFLDIFYPTKKGNMLSFFSPYFVYKQKKIKTSASFAVSQQVDSKYVIVPLHFLFHLTQNFNQVTSLALSIDKGYTAEKLKKKVERVLPTQFVVHTYLEQNASLDKAIYAEKFILWITFFFLWLVAYLNIFFVLYILIINKRKDITILYALGIGKSTIKRIFLCHGFLLSFIGTFLGIFLALILIFLQDKWGCITLGIDTAVVDAYPVKIIVKDMCYVLMGMFCFTFLLSYYPSKMATKLIHKKWI